MKAGLLGRMTAETPPFFRKVRKTGLALAAVAGTLLAAPVALPAALLTAAEYLAVAGAVMTAVAQSVTEGEW